MSSFVTTVVLFADREEIFGKNAGVVFVLPYKVLSVLLCEDLSRKSVAVLTMIYH